VDDGVSSRGHRENLLSRSFRFVGVGAGPHSEMTNTNTLDFAGGVNSKTGSRSAPSIPEGPARASASEESKVQPPVSSKVGAAMGKFARPDPNKWPEGATGCSENITTETRRGRTIKKTTMIYTFPDGHTESRQKVEML
jgi:hypothetical protein